MKTLQTPSGTIAYDERGPAAAETFVLLPSGAHDHHDYDELRALLPESARSIALDWPAHGASPAGTEPGTAMHLADVAEQLVEELAPGGAIVVGNSVGGFSAGRLAIRRPELVRGLVLIDSGGFAGRPLHVRAFCTLMARPDFLRRIYPLFSGRYMRARTEADRRARDTGVATTRRDPGLRAVAELWGSFASPEHDLRAGAGSISAPTLVIWGKHDPVLPLRLGRSVAKLIPGAELAVLDTGHVPHTTDPAGVARLLLPFAASLRTRDEAGPQAAAA